MQKSQDGRDAPAKASPEVGAAPPSPQLRKLLRDAQDHFHTLYIDAIHIGRHFGPNGEPPNAAVCEAIESWLAIYAPHVLGKAEIEQPVKAFDRFLTAVKEADHG